MSSISRPCHVLKREKSVAIARHFVFFDTETSQKYDDDGNIIQVFKLGWAVYHCRSYGRHKEVIEWFSFTNISEFWDFVFNHTYERQKLWVIARNIVFDFTVCEGWKHLLTAGYKLKFFHNNGVSVIVSVVHKRRSIVFLDSMNWFTESLAKTGERIGIPKLSIDFDTCSFEELSNYCRNDVLIEFENFRLFIRFLEGNTISRLCYTKASTAMAAYLLRHYHTPIWIHNNAEAIKLERESYKGGRCECFRLGDFENEKYYILDVNSLYPFVMRGRAYPVKYISIKHNQSPKDLLVQTQSKSVVAAVSIDTNEPVYAVKMGRTIFPIGIFDAVLTTPEIQYALYHNHIKQVYDCVYYEQADIFTTYVDRLYQLRRDFASAGVKEYEVLCKYLLNSLYGKFGQKAENWEKIGIAPDEPDREELIFSQSPRKVSRLRYLLGEVFELKSYSESFNSFPAIASHVTAYARLYLWSLMQIAGVGNFVYCDTDSLVVNEEGLYNLSDYMSETELGKLKLQEEVSHLILRGLKDYDTDTKNVIKGIRKTAVKIDDNTYTQQQWPTFKGLLKSDNPNVYTVHNITKHLGREYKKGVVCENGFIQPFRLLPT